MPRCAGVLAERRRSRWESVANIVVCHSIWLLQDPAQTWRQCLHHTGQSGYGWHNARIHRGDVVAEVSR